MNKNNYPETLEQFVLQNYYKLLEEKERLENENQILKNKLPSEEPTDLLTFPEVRYGYCVYRSLIRGYVGSPNKWRKALENNDIEALNNLNGEFGNIVIEIKANLIINNNGQKMYCRVNTEDSFMPIAWYENFDKYYTTYEEALNEAKRIIKETLDEN